MVRQRICDGPTKVALALILFSYLVTKAESHLVVQSYVYDKDSASLSRCPKANAEFSPNRLTLLRINPATAPPPAELEYDVLEDDEVESGNSHRIEELSEAEVAQLIESGVLQLVAADEDENAESGTTPTSTESEVYDADGDDNDDDEERTSKKRPWRKIKRILRRTLIKKPKRAFKKFAHEIGIRRQLRSTWSLSPLRTGETDKSAKPLDAQEVGILMSGKPNADEC